tara:strand:- start:294 stop:458 length:165 start_codon:yes stop_codon:yes gene_type:complete
MIANEAKDFILWKPIAKNVEKSLNNLFSNNNVSVVVNSEGSVVTTSIGKLAGVL